MTISLYDDFGWQRDYSVDVSMQFMNEHYGVDADGNRGERQQYILDWKIDSIDGQPLSMFDGATISEIKREIRDELEGGRIECDIY